MFLFSDFQILVEFWLNQNTADSISSNVLSHGQVHCGFDNFTWTINTGILSVTQLMFSTLLYQ